MSYYLDSLLTREQLSDCALNDLFMRLHTVGTCACCTPYVRNGVSMHEIGCPNRKHECKGCKAPVRASQKYCNRCS